MKRLRPYVLSGFAALIVAAGSHAQMLDAVKGAMGGGGTAGAMPDLGTVGTGNLAGVIGYCARNNYLGGGDAAGIQDKLLGKLGGEQQAQSDPGYQEGLGGVLGGQSGTKMELGGDGLKAQLTEKVCDQVLEYGKSSL